MTLRSLALALGLASFANAATYWSGRCNICHASNRDAQCFGNDSPTMNERGCGVFGWGCEYECNGVVETTAWWSGQCTTCWWGKPAEQCSGHAQDGAQYQGCGFMSAGCQYMCDRTCPSTTCGPGYTRTGSCWGLHNNYQCVADPTYVPIADAQPPKYEEFEALGAQVPPQVASIVGDPHIALPHGGRADFRGEDKTYYNFLSAKDLSLNVMTELANFELHPSNSTRHKHVHGSFLTQAHVVARTSTGKIVRASFWADKIGEKNIGWANGTVGDEPVFVMGPKTLKTIDDVTLTMTYASLVVTTPQFEIIVTPFKFRLERNVVGLHHRLDVQIKLRVPEEKMAVAPHGIIGQGWDGDGKAVNGEKDVFPVSGDFTTYAMAKGAIEGSHSDYQVGGPYAVYFKYSRFDLTEAPPRDVASLVAAGVLNAPVKGFASEFVGSTEYNFTEM